MITDSIRAFLQQRIEVEKKDVGMVVGLVDEHGSSIVSYGKMDDGTSQEVNGDTWFEIGSITKTFTALLLQDMIERGEMKLDDPVAEYLPKSVSMPTCNGKEITLFHLATHTSGLPRNPDNHDPKRADNPEADYTTGKLYAFGLDHLATRRSIGRASRGQERRRGRIRYVSRIGNKILPQNEWRAIDIH